MCHIMIIMPKKLNLFLNDKIIFTGYINCNEIDLSTYISFVMLMFMVTNLEVQIQR